MAPKLDAIGIITADMSKARRFYAMLGLQFPENDDDHLEATAPSGLRIMLDTVELMKQLDPEWEPPVGRRMGLAFRCDSPDDVNRTFAKIAQAGYKTKDTAPYDAFWGQRYASLIDPDGNVVDIFADLPRG